MKNKSKLLLYIVNILFISLILRESASALILKTNSALKDITASIEDVNQEKKVIYLTFDDGPSVNTDKVLDILKENQVKATFFIIGNQITGFEDVIKRIHDDGHSIGLHTYSHKFKRIYSNRDTFIKEMLQCREEINKLTGISPNIIRFPGGSSKRLTNAYLVKLHSYNFKIYDWNMVAMDGINSKFSPNRLFSESTKGSEIISNIILLMHCDYMHKNTCLALPRIIQFYKARGYEFKVITEDTPEIYYPIKK